MASGMQAQVFTKYLCLCTPCLPFPCVMFSCRHHHTVWIWSIGMEPSISMYWASTLPTELYLQLNLVLWARFHVSRKYILDGFFYAWQAWLFFFFFLPWVLVPELRFSHLWGDWARDLFFTQQAPPQLNLNSIIFCSFSKNRWKVCHCLSKPWNYEFLETNLHCFHIFPLLFSCSFSLIPPSLPSFPPSLPLLPSLRSSLPLSVPWKGLM